MQVDDVKRGRSPPRRDREMKSDLGLALGPRDLRLLSAPHFSSNRHRASGDAAPWYSLISTRTLWRAGPTAIVLALVVLSLQPE